MEFATEGAKIIAPESKRGKIEIAVALSDLLSRLFEEDCGNCVRIVQPFALALFALAIVTFAAGYQLHHWLWLVATGLVSLVLIGLGLTALYSAQFVGGGAALLRAVTKGIPGNGYGIVGGHNPKVRTEEKDRLTKEDLTDEPALTDCFATRSTMLPAKPTGRSRSGI